ncbi:Inositol phosphosphingolipids phospholipase C [Hondaea fermentalgiana]|uniref:Inositol phosphosphingolipids phospholipase C n=1 Tax=Hondaea fermentalgiana TaxID=2315210 RepID=A0A2R5G0X1_9STRA|nr:Inositol phosphosphingolipids phospholipase C [Hondaea fermentalgiana]|eukprot:GBG24667.1 Inositol phosphosphingolipids phospholipase C [Hondaea fermentalgiana]
MWNQTARDARYGRRLAILVDTIIKADADIVILQEVRFDTTFGIAHGPCQLEHLLQKLAYPYFVHQPAMGFVGNGFSYEGDEGVSILSRYPIIDSSYKLLSRQNGNGMPIAQIFAGDVNDEPGSPALEPLQGRGFRDNVSNSLDSTRS